jgi:hypothetical protein
MSTGGEINFSGVGIIPQLLFGAYGAEKNGNPGTFTILKKINNLFKFNRIWILEFGHQEPAKIPPVFVGSALEKHPTCGRMCLSIYILGEIPLWQREK